MACKQNECFQSQLLFKQTTAPYGNTDNTSSRFYTSLHSMTEKLNTGGIFSSSNVFRVMKSLKTL